MRETRIGCLEEGSYPSFDDIEQMLAKLGDRILLGVK
jgi:hypothetical protein